VDGRAGVGIDLAGDGVPAPTHVDLHRVLPGLVQVQLDDAELARVVVDAEVVDDALHPAVGVVVGGQEVVEGSDVVVDD
jgi:hypothetical protein